MRQLFNEAELRCLRALLDTVIPPDDYPGAWEAGVGDYLLRQLQGDLAHLAGGYRGFLRRLDAEARASHACDFRELPLDARTDTLRQIEHGEGETAAFFAQIVEHCGEGYYSDPGNGGNRGGIAWRMIGWELSA